MYLLTSAVGGIIGGAFRTVGSVASAAGTGIGAAAPKVADVANVDVTDVRAEAAEYLSDAPSDPALMTPAIILLPIAWDRLKPQLYMFVIALSGASTCASGPAGRLPRLKSSS